MVSPMLLLAFGKHFNENILEHSHSHSHSTSQTQSRTSSIRNVPTSGETTPTQKRSTPIDVVDQPNTHRSRARSPLYSPRSSTSSSTSELSLYGHPAATRASLVQTAQDIAHAASSPPTSSSLKREHLHRHSVDSAMSVHPVSQEVSQFHPDERTPLLSQDTRADSSSSSESSLAPSVAQKPHQHSHGAHAPGSMNMRALVLHVLGDALGNVGVIATGLIIWLTTWKYKYYCDPIISLVITAIIFSSALPLGKSRWT